MQAHCTYLPFFERLPDNNRKESMQEKHKINTDCMHSFLRFALISERYCFNLRVKTKLKVYILCQTYVILTTYRA